MISIFLVEKSYIADAFIFESIVFIAHPLNNSWVDFKDL
jgi:hypothetical protein